MASSWQCVLVILVVLCRLSAVLAAKGGGDECSVEQAVRLDEPTIRANTSCGYVEGRVQLCEEGIWKNLCDTLWTVEDAKVTCRSLNYTAAGAQNRETLRTAVGSSKYGVNCTGGESNISECIRNKESDTGDCSKAIFVLCFTDENSADMNCMEGTQKTETDPEPEPETSTTPATASPTAPTTTTPAPSSTLSTVAIVSSMTTEPLTQTEESRGFFTTPALYYFIGGLSAIVLAIVALVLILVLCCCGRFCHKVSPTDSERQEKGVPSTSLYGEDSQKAKDHEATTHHQLQQSSMQPIYEAINEDSSANNSQQGSPSSKPLMNTELYATLDNTNTYAQIQPHIPVREVFSLPVTPDPSTNYQVLHHSGSRTQSLKRNLPSRPQAVNRLALMEDERDFADLNSSDGVKAGHSKSLPRHTGLSSTSLPHPHSPDQNKIKLQNLMLESESTDQANIYHVLEPSPQYGNLGQIAEHSTASNTAVCNNDSHSKHSPPFSPKYSQYPHPRSATLPSTQSLPGAHSSSPRTSRSNSQSSNSPQTSRPNRSPQSKSPQISRVGGGSRYSESPSSTRGASSSPNVNCSAFSNRLSAHSGQSDSNDVQSNLSERSAIDTLV